MPPNEVVTVRTGQPMPPQWSAALFLAGPTHRKPQTERWRADAITELRRQWGGHGKLVVFDPEPPEGSADTEFLNHVTWEEVALHMADVIVFWVPRDLNHLPGFNTNVEFGRWYTSGKVVFGAPPDAPNNRYLLHYAHRHHVPTAATLPETVAAALAHIGTGAPRCDGEREVPVLLWRTTSFRRWYTALRQAGNTLLGARLTWTFRVGPTEAAVFYWALHVKVHISAENRVKANEVLISRPDVSTVALYHPAASPEDTIVVLVREYRASAATPDGFIRELPGGAAIRDDPREQAVAELFEETGLTIDPARLRDHGSRQFAGTAMGHHGHLFSAPITSAELDRLRQLAHTAHGNAEDGERTWLEFRTLADLRASHEVDWSTLGMIYQALDT